MALKVLENTDVKKYGKHYSESADGLELMDRVFTETQDALWSEIMMGGFDKLDDPQYAASVMDSGNIEKIWKNVLQARKLFPAEYPGHHTFHIVVMDQEGNVICGTNTIESFAWGEGIFVEGIPLNGAGNNTYYQTQPGERVLSPLSMQMGFKDKKPRFADGTMGSSEAEAAFQFVVNLVDYGLPAKDAASKPRFGAVPLNHTHSSFIGNARSLDKRIKPIIVDALTQRGVDFTQDEDLVETGFGSIAIDPGDGTLDGAIAPFPGFPEAPWLEYRRAEPGTKVPPVRPFLKIDPSTDLVTEGDEAHGSKAVAKIENGTIEVQIETGTGWGSQLTLLPNIGPFVGSSHLLDLRGYRFFEFKALAPKGFYFAVHLDESGIADRSSTDFIGMNGADGESYRFPPFQGTGQWETFRTDISKLSLNDNYGNQAGNHVLDLQALNDMGFVFFSKQGDGKVFLKDINFLVK
jgi:hypothetical protein